MPRARRIVVLLLVIVLMSVSSSASAERRTVRGGTIMNLGAGFLIGGGGTAPGVGVSFASHITNAPVFLGLDTGSYFYSSPFAWILPALLAVKYAFRPVNVFTLTAGLSLGPTLAIGNYANTLSFAMFFKPGIEIGVTREIDFVFEPRFGVIGSTFVFDPEFQFQFNM